MFDNFERARTGKRSRWLYGILAGVIGLHGVLLLGLVAKSWWQVDKLTLPAEGVAIAVAAPPPAPPPARKGSPDRAKSVDKDTPKVERRPTSDPTQPIVLSDEVPANEGGDGDDGP